MEKTGKAIPEGLCASQGDEESRRIPSDEVNAREILGDFGDGSRDDRLQWLEVMVQCVPDASGLGTEPMHPDQNNSAAALTMSKPT